MGKKKKEIIRTAAKTENRQIKRISITLDNLLRRMGWPTKPEYLGLFGEPFPVTAEVAVSYLADIIRRAEDRDGIST